MLKKNTINQSQSRTDDGRKIPFDVNQSPIFLSNGQGQKKPLSLLCVIENSLYFYLSDF